MKWNWSLKKLAAEDAVQPVPPQQPQMPAQQIQPKVEPALTPVVQNPPVPHPQKPLPVHTGWGLPKDQTAEQLLKNPNYVKSARQFVTRNLESIKDSGDVTPHAAQAFQQYKANAETARFFETVARPMVEQAALSYEDFIGKVDAHKSQDTSQGLDAAMQEAGFIENDKDETIANGLIQDSLVRLEDTGNSYLSDWITQVASKTNNQGQLTSEAQGIPGALHNFLFNKAKGGGIKWKSFFKTYFDLTPKDVKKRMPQTQGSIYKAINQSIYEWYKDENKGGFEQHPCLTVLEDLMMNNDERIKKALLECARSEGTDVGQVGLSHSNTSGDKGQSFTDNMTSNANEDVADTLSEPKMDSEDAATGEKIIDNFLDRHPDFTEKLRAATYPGESFSMIEAIAKQASQQMGTEEVSKAVDDLLNSILRYPILGTVYEQDENGGDTTIPERNKWNDFFTRYDNLLPQQIDLDSDSLSENSAAAMPIIGSPQAQQFLDEYMGDPSKQTGECYDYLKKLYEMSSKKFGKLKTYLPEIGDIKQISRLGKITYGALYRSFRLRQQDGSAPFRVGTSARGYALIKAKTKAITALLLQLANTQGVVWVTKNKCIYKNENNEIIVKQKIDGSKGAKKVEWSKTKLSDQNFSTLVEAVPSNWVDGMYDTLQGKEKAKGQIDYPAALSKKDPATTIKKYPMAQDFQNAADQFLQENPDNPDRLAGWRMHLAKILNGKVQQLSQALGKQITAQDIVERIKKNKTQRKNSSRTGARIDGVQAVEKLLSGQPTPYDENAFNVISKALSTFPEENGTAPIVVNPHDIFAPCAKEYDKYNYDDRTSLMSIVPNLLNHYGQYLVHRKREALRRGQRDDFFTDRAFWCFLNLVGTRKFDGEEEKKMGWFAHELTGGKPLDPTHDPKDIEENLSRMLVKQKGDVPAHYVPLEKSDVYDGIGYRKRPQRYYPDENHPTGYQQQEEMADTARVFRDVAKRMKTDPDSPFKDIKDYRKNAIQRWTETAKDNTAELLEARLSQHQSPVSIAKELLGKHFPPDQVDQQLAKRMNDYNSLLAQSGSSKQFDIEEYATKLVNNAIFNHRQAQESATANLKNLQQLETESAKGDKDPGYYVNMLDQLKMFLPAKLKNKWAEFFQHNRSVPENKAHIEELANSTRPEKLQQDLTAQPPIEVAKSIFMSKGMNDAQALEKIKLKMNQWNKRVKNLNTNAAPDKQKPVYKTVEEYAKHYVEEVIRLESYYREVAKKRLEQIGTKEKRDIDFPKFSQQQLMLLKMSEQLTDLRNQQSTFRRFGRSKAFMEIVDYIVDSGIRKYQEYVRSTQY